jgi:uncharacterized protein (DUF58 family)
MTTSQNAPSRFLDLRALAALAHMRFTTRRRVEGAYSGRHPSRQQGGAGEFVDFREYSGSEDLRRLDWKVYSRTGKAFVRLHQEETNLACTLALDASASMRFGARTAADAAGSKLQYAQYLATALSHVIAMGQDHVGLAVLDERLREWLPPSGTPTHVALVQSVIEELVVRPSRMMSEALRDLFQRSRRRGTLILLSDFLCEDLDRVFAAMRLFRHRGWEIVAVHLIHPDEENLPEGSAFRFEGPEGEGVVACSPGEIRAEYRRRFSRHLESVRQLALAVGCDYRRTSTGVGYMKTLGQFLIDRTG